MDLKLRTKASGGTNVGAEILRLMTELYPICRSITGAGFRETLGILERHTPLEVHEVPSGKQIFDWAVPKEWNIRDAYVKNARGERVIDFRRSNLHVVSYSVPVRKTMPWAELKGHLHTLPAHPDWIPYRTSYYREDWGFCLSHNDFLNMEDGIYEVVIDSTLEDGFLTYAELFLEGRARDEILISSHACHPSLANDNLSGVCISTMLAKHLSSTPHDLSYRFLFIPGTIGAIAWLALNEGTVQNIRGGLVLAGLGDGGPLTYKKSRRSDTAIDRAAAHVLRHARHPGLILDFSPYGYDERQFCSPGFDLPVGRLSRTPFGEYPEYHTSADNLDFVLEESLGDSFDSVLAILEILEANGTFINLSPKCEPQLGKRGLYASPGAEEMALLWILNLSDGEHRLLDIAEKSKLEFAAIRDAAGKLVHAGLLEEILEDPGRKRRP
jgi:aminopeptidase-like protein